MSIQRTKNQIACDGIRMAWNSDPFTEILYHQVETQFSMDGVIPPVQAGTSIRKKRPANCVVLPKRRIEKLANAVDGIRLMPWKPAPKTA